MYELIQIFQADEDALLAIGSNEGKLKKITADFIEDYASDLENPSIMLQRIVSYEIQCHSPEDISQKLEPQPSQ